MGMRSRAMISIGLLAGLAAVVAAQDPPKPVLETIAPEKQVVDKPSPETSRDKPAADKTADDAKADRKSFLVDTGTHIPLSLMNSVSTKNSVPGDRVYLETVFPILVDSRIVIPPGSYVEGTITDVQRPGKVKGRGEFHVRFDLLILPNGTTRDFRARVSGIDGRATEELDRKEGSIKSEGNKGGDARTIGETTAAGASIGALAGSLSGAAGMGAGIGAAAGATAGLIGVLFTRGPEAVLAKGTSLEMVLDRPVDFDESELDFSNSPTRRSGSDGPGPLPSKKTQPARRMPLQ
jgi:hypothetical protein